MPAHRSDDDDQSPSRSPSPLHHAESDSTLAETTTLRQRRRAASSWSTAVPGEGVRVGVEPTAAATAASHWPLTPAMNHAPLRLPLTLPPPGAARATTASVASLPRAAAADSPNSTVVSDSADKRTLRASDSAMRLRGSGVALPPSPNALAPLRDRGRSSSCVAEPATPAAAAVASGPASMPCPTRCLLPEAINIDAASRSQSAAAVDQQELALRSRSTSAKTRRCGDMSPALSGSQTLSPLIVTRKQMAAMLSMALPPTNAGSLSGPVKAQEWTASWAPSVSRSLNSDQAVPSSSAILPQIPGSSLTPSSPARSLTLSPCDSRLSRLSIADRDSCSASSASAQSASSLESSASVSPMQRVRATSCSSLAATSPSVGGVRSKSTLRRIEVPLSPPPAASPSAGPAVDPAPSPPLSATAPLTPEIMARFGLLLRFFQSPTCRLFSQCAWPISIYQRDLAAMCKGHSSALAVLRTLEALNAADTKFGDMASLTRALHRAIKKQGLRQLVGNGGALDQVFEDPTLLDAHPFSSPLIKEHVRPLVNGCTRARCTPPTDGELEELLDVCGGSLNRASKVFVLFLLEESPPRNAFRSVSELILATRLLLAGKDVGTIGLGLDAIDPEMLDATSDEDSGIMEMHDDGRDGFVDEGEYSLLQGLPALGVPAATESAQVNAEGLASAAAASPAALAHASSPRPLQRSSRLDDLMVCGGQLELLGH